jgi:predicted ATPase
MLEKIWVDNFRSLDDFTLEIVPGLNVLVGPNGAGKTSIIKWFEFLSLLGNHTLRESIGKMGGANHVFRRQDDKYSDTLKFELTGFTYIDTEMYAPPKAKHTQKQEIRYQYIGVISVVENQIFFSQQHIEVWLIHNKNKKYNEKPDILISWKYDIVTDKITTDVKSTRPKHVKDNYLESYFFNEGFLQKIYNSYSLLENMISPGKFFPVDYIYSIKEDISFKKAYNINPVQVRSAIDISSQPGVQYDGSGTVSTIYDIKIKASDSRNRYTLPAPERLKQKESFPKLLNYLRLSDPNIEAVDVSIDSFRNEFILEIEYYSENNRYKVPIFLISDGTAKWLSLITALSTESQSLFIEEPENFLHPKLQESVVDIIRAEVSVGPHERFALISTHSETLLNRLLPQEIILVNMIGGKTHSTRVENPEEISQIIADFGFGLGYYYVSGGL